MRRKVLAAGAMLGLHTLAVACSFAYRDLVFDAGALFTRARHMEDIPQNFLFGFISLGIVAAVAGVIFERLWRWIRVED